MKASSRSLPRYRVDTSIRLGAFLLVGVSALALFLTQRLYVSSGILVFASLLAWNTGRKLIPEAFWEIASFCYLLFFFFDLFRLSGSLAPSLVHLFVFIIINKIFNLRTDRDYYQLYLLTFLSMLAASSLYVEVSMMYAIVAYILLLVWNVISITLFREWREGESRDVFPFSLFGLRYILLTLVASVVTFVFALFIFFIVPRMQLGYFAGLNPGKVQHVSGFSQKVELGDIANIQTDAGEAMRVRVTSPVPLKDRLYWRGIAFDHYDGRTWSTTQRGTRFLHHDSSNNFFNSQEKEGEILVHQEFYLAPLDTRVVFGLDRAIRIKGDFAAISKDINGTLTGMSQPASYEVESRLVPVVPEELRKRTGQMSDGIRRFYTQTPKNQAEIERLARSITEGKTTLFDRVLAVQEYLETNYRYSTTNLPLDSVDPISEFLFSSKSGHCEYFATAMTLLLRHLGIAARPVNGFLQGEYNDLGDFYLIRQSDAHSWVEVYFGEGLWVHFDPSPRVLPGGGATAWWRRIDFRKILDSIEFFWDRYILIYSAQDQLDSLSSVQERYQEIRERAREKTGRNWKPVVRSFWRDYRSIIGIILVLAAAAIFWLRIILSRRRKLRLIRSPILFYQHTLSILERKGFSRPPEATPGEFLKRVSENMEDEYQSDLSSITELFYQARFGNHILTAEEQSRVQSALERLEQMK